MTAAVPSYVAVQYMRDHKSYPPERIVEEVDQTEAGPSKV